MKVGHLHRVLATVDGRDGSLSLDDGDTVFGSSRGFLSSLNIQPTLYVGRVPSSTVSAMYPLRYVIAVCHPVANN